MKPYVHINITIYTIALKRTQQQAQNKGVLSCERYREREIERESEWRVTSIRMTERERERVIQRVLARNAENWVMLIYQNEILVLFAFYVGALRSAVCE